MIMVTCAKGSKNLAPTDNTYFMDFVPNFNHILLPKHTKKARILYWFFFCLPINFFLQFLTRILCLETMLKKGKLCAILFCSLLNRFLVGNEGIKSRLSRLVYFLMPTKCAHKDSFIHNL